MLSVPLFFFRKISSDCCVNVTFCTPVMESQYHCKISDFYKLSENFLVYVQQSARLNVREFFLSMFLLMTDRTIFVPQVYPPIFSANIRRDTSMEICIDIMRWRFFSTFCQKSQNVDGIFHRRFLSLTEMSM